MSLDHPSERSKKKALGTVCELSTSNPGAEVPQVVPEAPNVCARGADDANMGDEVSQSGVSHTDSVNFDEIRESRRRNSPSNPTSRKIEDHVLGYASGVQPCKGEVEPRDTRHKAARKLRMAQRSQSLWWDHCFLGPGIVSTRLRFEQRGDSPVLVKSIFPAKGVDLQAVRNW